MKNLILALSLLTLVGCATTEQPNVTAQHAEVENWFRSELIRINEKKFVVRDMMLSGQIELWEYDLLMEACEQEKADLPARARVRFGYPK